MANMDNMLLVDGNSLINREFFGVRTLTSSGGIPTNAVYGFVNVIAKHIADLEPRFGATCWDLKGPTFRHKLYDGYKAGRNAMPDELGVQLPYAKRVSELFGLKVVSLEGWEADDDIGTLSRLGSESGIKVYILTGDRDSLQLIDDNTTVLLVGNKGVARYGRSEFFDEWGIQPEQFVDLKAVMGDSSDKIPGVRGVGQKTAPDLIARYGSLDGLYAAIEADGFSDPAITKGTLNKLLGDKDMAYLSQKLARIDRDAPLGLTPDDIRVTPLDKPGMLRLCRELDFTAFIDRFGLRESENTAAAYKKSGDVYEDVSADPAAAFDALDREAMCGIWISRDLRRISAAQGERRITAELTDADGLKALKPFLEDEGRNLAVHDVKSLLHRLAPLGIRINAAFDVMLAAYVLDSSENGLDLSKLCGAYLSAGLDEGQEAGALIGLAGKMSERLESEGGMSVFRDIELPLAYVLFDMESAGFYVDVDGLKEYGEKLGRLAGEYEKQIYLLAGREFNPNSPKQLGEVLFEEMKLPAPPGAKTKTGWSTSVDVLEKLADTHPIIDAIFSYRRVTKLKSTYCDGLISLADENGFVHTTFNQTITATGRLSSTEPNLQNIPIKTDQGRYLRNFFAARGEDMVLVDSDYSQIELRLLACIADDRTMIDAFRSGADIHTITASQVFGVPQEEVTPLLRKRAKAVNFGIVYGIGGHSLAGDIDVSFREASEYIKSYLAKYSGVDRYMKEIVAQAKEQGFVTTMAGRRRYIPELKSGSFQIRKFGERVAMNSPIQGTAADIIKIAMVKTAKALKDSGTGARLILQIHDELIVECDKKDADRVAGILKECMESAAELAVPLTVDTEIGHTWGDEG